jgi:hypothetical protein
MAIDQVITDCLAEGCAFRGQPHRVHQEHRGMTVSQARALNARSAGPLQHLVDELHRTEPRPERVYELRSTSTHGLTGVSHCVLLCSDLRVVYAEVGDGGVHTLFAFPHGALDVQNKLVKLRPELSMGPPPVLVWPRIAGEDDVLDLGVRHVMTDPSPHLRTLMARVAQVRPEIRVVARGTAPASPPGWHPDPAGRHQQRWWDGARWTEHVADAGVTVVDPL